MKPINVISAVASVIIRVVFTIMVVYYIYNGAMTCYDYGYRIFTEPAMTVGEGRVITVTITSDMSASDIGKLFESRGLVKDAKLFTLQYYFSEYLKDVKPGVFELNTNMTAEEMMAVMAAPKDGTDAAEK